MLTEQGATAATNARQAVNYRWIAVGLIFLAAAINYIDRTCIGIAGESIKKEFGLSNGQMGIILSAFLWSYMAMYGLAGAVMDRLGSRVGYALIMAWWSTAGFLTGLASSLAAFVGLRVALGIGEAGCWPANAKVVSEWFPPRERALATGIYDSGSKAGMILAPPAIAAIIAVHGWRAAFFVTGALGLLWLLLWLSIYRPARTSSNGAAAASDKTERLSWLQVLKSPGVWAVLSFWAAASPCWWTLSTWLPIYLQDARHVPIRLMGFYASVPFAAAFLGNIVGGWASGRLIREGNVVTGRVAACGIGALIMAAMVPAAFQSRVAVSVALLGVAAFGFSLSSTNFLSLPADLVPKTTVATTVGVVGTGANLLAVGFTMGAGYAADAWGWPLVLCFSGLLPLVGVLVGLALLRLARGASASC